MTSAYCCKKPMKYIHGLFTFFIIFIIYLYLYLSEKRISMAAHSARVASPLGSR